MRHQRWPYYAAVVLVSIALGALIAVSGYGGTKPPGLVAVPTTTTQTTAVTTPPP